MSDEILNIKNPNEEYKKIIKIIWIFLYIPMFVISFIGVFLILNI